MIDTILTAAKADSIPEGWSGLWFIRKAILDMDTLSNRNGKEVIVPAGSYTHLFRVTDSTLHQCPPGKVVMEDTPFELRTHLNFMLKAHGEVLVTGLGLGCVVRGLLANPAVTHVTCVENSPDVLKLVQPYMPKERLTIVEADALEWTKSNTKQFDAAWHDVWTDQDAGEPHLDRWHVEMMLNCRQNVKVQGAWGLSRPIKRSLGRWIELV